MISISRLIKESILRKYFLAKMNYCAPLLILKVYYVRPLSSTHSTRV